MPTVIVPVRSIKCSVVFLNGKVHSDRCFIVALSPFLPPSLAKTDVVFSNETAALKDPHFERGLVNQDQDRFALRDRCRTMGLDEIGRRRVVLPNPCLILAI